MHEPPVRLGRGSLGRDRHACVFIESVEDEYALCLPFIAEGLAQGERAFHVVDPKRRSEHFRRLESAGIDVRGALARRQLEVVGWNEAYLRDDRFEPRAMMGFLLSVLNEGRAAGFARTRLVAHMGWALEQRPGVERLIEYEAAVDPLLHRLPDPVLCTYDRSHVTAAAAMDVFGVHRVGVFGGGVRRNPLFGRPRRPNRREDVIPLLRRRYLAALLAGSTRDAVEVIVDEGLWLDVPLPALYLQVVQAAQRAIGRLWDAGRISVAEEHVASELSRLALAALRAHFPGEPRLGRSVSVACVEGERHDLGARLVADMLDMSGFDVSFLGADVPTDALAALVRDNPPDVLGLSVSATANVPALRAAVNAVRASTGDEVVLAVGGAAFATHPKLAHDLGFVVHAPDAGSLVTRLQRLFAAVERGIQRRQ